MTDLIKRDDALEPCPFCRSKASDTGFMTWSKALGFSASHFKQVIDSTNPATIKRIKTAAIRYKESIK